MDSPAGSVVWLGVSVVIASKEPKLNGPVESQKVEESPSAEKETRKICFWFDKIAAKRWMLRKESLLAERRTRVWRLPPCLLVEIYVWSLQMERRVMEDIERPWSQPKRPASAINFLFNSSGRTTWSLTVLTIAQRGVCQRGNNLWRWMPAWMPSCCVFWRVVTFKKNCCSYYLWI